MEEESELLLDKKISIEELKNIIAYDKKIEKFMITNLSKNEKSNKLICFDEIDNFDISSEEYQTAKTNFYSNYTIENFNSFVHNLNANLYALQFEYIANYIVAIKEANEKNKLEELKEFFNYKYDKELIKKNKTMQVEPKTTLKNAVSVFTNSISLNSAYAFIIYFLKAIDEKQIEYKAECLRNYFDSIATETKYYKSVNYFFKIRIEDIFNGIEKEYKASEIYLQSKNENANIEKMNDKWLHDIFNKLNQEIILNKSFSYNNFLKFINIENAYNTLKETEIEETIKLDEKEIENYIPKKSNTFTYANDKLSNTLSRIKNNELAIISNTAGKKAKSDENELKVLIRNAEPSYTNPIDNFDKLVLEAIYSLWLAGNTKFDIPMIKEILTRISRNFKTGQTELCKDIEKSIEKLRKTDMKLDITNFINKSFKTSLEAEIIKELSHNDIVLDLSYDIVRKSGYQTKMYNFKNKPPYFIYIEARGQCITTSNKDILAKISANTKEDTLLAHYIIKRIKDLKSISKESKGKPKYKTQPNLTYFSIDTIIEEAELLKEEYKNVIPTNLKEKIDTEQPLTAEEKMEIEQYNEPLKEEWLENTENRLKTKKKRFIDKIIGIFETLKECNKDDEFYISDYKLLSNKMEIIDKKATRKNIKTIQVIF